MRTIRSSYNQDGRSETLNWLPYHQKAFEEAKKAVHDHANLQFYDRNKQLYLEVDASENQIGCALMQTYNGTEHPCDSNPDINPEPTDVVPLAFAAKTLSPAERRYSNIEREALAIQIGLQKFYHWTWGNYVIVYSDQRPNAQMQYKNLYQMSPRLARIWLKIKCYYAEIRYKPGKEMAISDFLSRYACPTDTDPIPGLSLSIAEITDLNPNEIAITEDEIRDESKQDNIMKIIMTYIHQGTWPDRPEDIESHEVRQFHRYRDVLSVHNGILTHGHKMVYPSSMRQRVLEKLHNGHPGISQMRKNAIRHCFWPGITKDLEEKVKHCITCQTFNRKYATTEVRPLPNTSLPWQRIGVDIATINGKNYLIVVDYFSSYPFAVHLKRERACDTIAALEDIFNLTGYPQEMVCDNGRQLVSEDMRTYLRQKGIKQRTSAAEHQQGNGKVESMIKRIKAIAAKTQLNVQSVLRIIRMAPQADVTPPADILFRMRTRTMLPVLQTPRDEVLDGRFRKIVEDQEKMIQDQRKQHTPTQPGSIEIGFQVMFAPKKDSKNWAHATVVRTVPGHAGRQYELRGTLSGRMYLRDRSMICPTMITKPDYLSDMNKDHNQMQTAVNLELLGDAKFDPIHAVPVPVTTSTPTLPRTPPPPATTAPPSPIKPPATTNRRPTEEQPTSEDFADLVLVNLRIQNISRSKTK